MMQADMIRSVPSSELVSIIRRIFVGSSEVGGARVTSRTGVGEDMAE